MLKLQSLKGDLLLLLNVEDTFSRFVSYFLQVKYIGCWLDFKFGLVVALKEDKLDNRRGVRLLLPFAPGDSLRGFLNRV